MNSNEDGVSLNDAGNFKLRFGNLEIRPDAELRRETPPNCHHRYDCSMPHPESSEPTPTLGGASRDRDSVETPPTESKSNRPRRSSRRSKKAQGKADKLDAATIGPAKVDPSNASALSHASEAGVFAIAAGHADRYARVGELGRGGWGIVDRAVDRQLDREVAVKKIVATNANSPLVTDRFLHEAKITSQLQHPGIVPVHELGSDGDGNAYYVMKLLEGGTLRQQIRQRHAATTDRSKPLRCSELQDVIAPLLDRYVDICNAVAYAHTRGILHRDLKPANVMVGAYGETIVLDWGLAQQVNTDGQRTSITETDGTIVGTPAYMSPEQARGDLARLGKHSDIYSLGVMLYEIIAGRHPHAGLSVNEVLNRVQSEQYAPIRTCQPATPKPLAAIVDTAMAASPNARYASAESLAEDVRRFLAGDRVSVHCESLIDRTARWCRRNRSLAASISISVFALLILSTLFGLIVHRAHLSERTARLEAQSAHRVAVDRLMEARDATDAWLIDLSGSLEFYPGMQPLRQQLLNQAAEQYERLIASPVTFTGNNSSDRHGSARDHLTTTIAIHERAKCHLRLGDLYRLTDHSAASQSHYTQAAKLLHNLAKTESSRTALRSVAFSAAFAPSLTEKIRLDQINAVIGQTSLASGNVCIGEWEACREWLHHRLRTAEHQQDAIKSDFICKVASAAARLELAIHRRTPENANIKSLNTAVYWSRWLANRRGRPSDQQLSRTAQTECASVLEQQLLDTLASAAWTVLIEDIQDWQETHAGRVDDLQFLAHSRLRRAATWIRLERKEQACADYRQAILELEAAWQLTDSDSFFRTNLATAEGNLGRLLLDGEPKQQQEAERLLQGSLKTYQSMLQQQATAELLGRLAQTHIAMAKLQWNTVPSEALQHLEEATLAYQILRDHDQLSAQDQRDWDQISELAGSLKLSDAQRRLLENRAEGAQTSTATETPPDA
ncbi:serine/threonine-protein kinase [Novipirellula artificiosorum]|uniref:serine/threonine-protein kinase n=1 Tax=Novipirellula artificiosorum TaxID=2528016 RepID=UPI001E438FB7|nr:serine/threonine-protein kinase [Novipirellula artificiosorum]